MNRILWNDDECIDEIVLHDVTVHVEQMSDRCWWIGIYPKDHDRSWMGSFTCDSRGRMKFTEQENDGIEWEDERTHLSAPPVAPEGEGGCCEWPGEHSHANPAPNTEGEGT